MKDEFVFICVYVSICVCIDIHISLKLCVLRLEKLHSETSGVEDEELFAQGRRY